MKKIIILFILIASINATGYAQQFMTKNAFVNFYSKAALEDITADNNQAYSIIDVGKKDIAFSLLMKSFIFPKELMQQHFNENYVESDKYPKAVFSGSYTGDVAIDKDGVYKIMVKGNLTLHNVTKPVEMPATLEVKNGKLSGTAEFKIKPEDYNISIPSVVRDNIAKELTVTVKANYNPR
jgi:polyisoprenoid-binding protein YceI